MIDALEDTVELSPEVVSDILARERRIDILNEKGVSPLWNEFSSYDLAFLTGERRA